MSATQPTVAANATAIRAFIGWAPVQETPSRKGLADAEFGLVWLIPQRRKDRGRRIEFPLPIGSAVERQLVAAPVLHVPVLVDVGRGPGVFGREVAGCKR